MWVSTLFLAAEFPSLASLRLIKWQDEKGETKRYSLLKTVSSEWQRLGDLLQLSTDQLKNIKQKSDDNVERCREVFASWIDCEGCPPCYPLTWEGLFELLIDVDRHTAMQQLKQALENVL